MGLVVSFHMMGKKNTLVVIKMANDMVSGDLMGLFIFIRAAG